MFPVRRRRVEWECCVRRRMKRVRSWRSIVVVERRKEKGKEKEGKGS